MKHLKNQIKELLLDILRAIIAIIHNVGGILFLALIPYLIYELLRDGTDWNKIGLYVTLMVIYLISRYARKKGL